MHSEDFLSATVQLTLAYPHEPRMFYAADRHWNLQPTCAHVSRFAQASTSARQCRFTTAAAIMNELVRRCPIGQIWLAQAEAMENASSAENLQLCFE
jgi:hypothetical protein